MLAVVIGFEPEFDKYVKKGTIQGIENYLNDRKITYSIVQKENGFQKRVYQADGVIQILETCANMMTPKLENNIQNQWDFLLTKKRLYHEYKELHPMGFFKSGKAYGRGDIANCIISDKFLVADTEEEQIMMGKVVAYHECMHSSSYEHCSIADCIFSEISLEDIKYHVKLWLNSGRPALCDKHKI